MKPRDPVSKARLALSRAMGRPIKRLAALAWLLRRRDLNAEETKTMRAAAEQVRADAAALARSAHD